MPARATADATPPPATGGNAPEWTVSELSGAIKRQLEGEFGFVRLRGEISNYRGPHSSGHAYFCIKDEGARIDAVMWKGQFSKLRIRPEEGMEVVATGRITTFAGKSAYQIVVEALEPAGAGALMALLEARRKALAAEGLFAAERKRPLPYLPRVVGVVTSPTGAVIRDILHRLEDRFPTDLLLWPVRVQGETCAEEVAAAIRGFNALGLDGPIPRPDLLIVARGGGSIEDLWGFNEEIVVRAAAESAIPLISAVGHETDTTLIDLAADRRAPTPTGAAEMAVPVRADLVAEVAALGRRLAAATARGLDRARSDVRGLTRALPAPDALLARPRQRLDLAEARLPAAFAKARRGAEDRLARAATGFQRNPPTILLARVRARLDRIGDRPRQALETRVMSPRLRAVAERARLLRRERDRLLDRPRTDLARLSQLFASLNYRAVLARGFALVHDEEGRPLKTASATRDGQRVAIEFADASVAATIGQGASPAAAPARKPAKAPAAPRQGSLFEA